MSDNNVTQVEAEENDPIYYNPKYLNIISTLSGVFSWIVLAGFIGLAVGQYVILTQLSQGTSVTELIANPQALNWIYTNIVTPILIGIVSFFVLQGAAIGLNVLLEIDFNARDSK